MDECILQDLGFNRPSFSWTSRRDGDEEVLVRLDRAFGNSEN